MNLFKRWFGSAESKAPETPPTRSEPEKPKKKGLIELAEDAITSDEPAYEILHDDRGKMRGIWVRDSRFAVHGPILKMFLANADLPDLARSEAALYLATADFLTVNRPEGKGTDVLFGNVLPTDYQAPDVIPLWQAGEPNPICSELRFVQNQQRLRFACGTCGYPQQLLVHDIGRRGMTPVCGGCGNVADPPVACMNARKADIYCGVRVPVAEFSSWYFAHPLHGRNAPEVEAIYGLRAFCAVCKTMVPNDILAPLAIEQRPEMLEHMADRSWLDTLDFRGLDKGACGECGSTDLLAIRAPLSREKQRSYIDLVKRNREKNWYDMGHLVFFDFLAVDALPPGLRLPDTEARRAIILSDAPMDQRRDAIKTLKNRPALEALLRDCRELSLKTLIAYQLIKGKFNDATEYEGYSDELDRRGKEAAATEILFDTDEIATRIGDWEWDEFTIAFAAYPKPELAELALKHCDPTSMRSKMSMIRRALQDDARARQEFEKKILPYGAINFSDEFDLTWPERVELANRVARECSDEDPRNDSGFTVSEILNRVLDGERHESSVLRESISDDNHEWVNNVINHEATMKETRETYGLQQIHFEREPLDLKAMTRVVHHDWSEVPRRGQGFLERQAAEIPETGIRMNKAVVAVSARDIAEHICAWGAPFYLVINDETHCIIKFDQLDDGAAAAIWDAARDAKVTLTVTYVRTMTYPLLSMKTVFATTAGDMAFEAVPDLADADVHDALNCLLRDGKGILHFFHGDALELVAEGYFGVKGELKKTLTSAATDFFKLGEDNHDYQAAARGYLEQTSL